MAVKTYKCDPVRRCSTTASLRSGAPCIFSVTFAAKTSMKTAFPLHNDAARILKHDSASSTLWATNATTSRSESLETSNLWPSCMAIASSASSVGIHVEQICFPGFGTCYVGLTRLNVLKHTLCRQPVQLYTEEGLKPFGHCWPVRASTRTCLLQRRNNISC